MLRVANCTAFSGCHQSVNHPVYNPVDALWVARLGNGGDLWQGGSREASGNHQDAQDLPPKCIVRGWPFSHPKPSGGSREDSCSRAGGSPLASGPSQSLSPIDGGTVGKTGSYFYRPGKLPGQGKVSSLISPFIV